VDVVFLNTLLGRSIDLLLWPFAELPPAAGLAFVSLLTAAAMLVVFKATTDQRRLAAVKRQIHAGIFEIRLFRDDPAAIIRAQLDLLRHNFVYLRLSLVPMLCMIVPMALVVSHLEFHYGYDGLEIGQPVLVTVRLRDGVDPAPARVASVSPASLGVADPGATLDAPAPIRVETPAVWLPATHEVIWRIVPVEAGDYDLRVTVGGDVLSKTLRVADTVARRSPARVERGYLNQLWYPSEPPLPSDSPVSAISVAYPRRDVSVFGWRTHWLVVYGGASLLLALVLRRPFNVQM
jgi:hypothetical protein